MTINYITSEVAIQKSTKIEGNIVTVTCSTKHPTGVVRCDWVLDFSDCTPDEILGQAAANIVIKEQIDLRKRKKSELESTQSQKIDVHARLNRKRIHVKNVPTVESLTADAKELTTDQLVETIAALQAKIDAAE